MQQNLPAPALMPKVPNIKIFCIWLHQRNSCISCIGKCNGRRFRSIITFLQIIITERFRICLNCCDLFLFCLFYRYFRSYLRCYFRILFTFKYQGITVITLRQTGFGCTMNIRESPLQSVFLIQLHFHLRSSPQNNLISVSLK